MLSLRELCKWQCEHHLCYLRNSVLIKNPFQKELFRNALKTFPIRIKPYSEKISNQLKDRRIERKIFATNSVIEFKFVLILIVTISKATKLCAFGWGFIVPTFLGEMTHVRAPSTVYVLRAGNKSIAQAIHRCYLELRKSWWVVWLVMLDRLHGHHHHLREIYATMSVDLKILTQLINCPHNGIATKTQEN